MVSLYFTITLELWRPRIVQLVGLSWSGCREGDHDHAQEGDDQGQQGHNFHQQSRLKYLVVRGKIQQT